MSTDLRIKPQTAPRRRYALRVAEMMMLVALLAFGLAWFRSVADAWSGARPTGGPVFARRALAAIHATLPGLAVATLALLAASFRPPWPTAHQAVRQPGRLACGVASCFLLAAFIGSVVSFILSGLFKGWLSAGMTLNRLLDDLSDSLDAWGYLVGLAVLVAWVVLGFIRGWRCEPTWLDRLGRLIGWGWVVLAPLAVGLRVVVDLGMIL